MKKQNSYIFKGLFLLVLSTLIAISCSKDGLDARRRPKPPHPHEEVPPPPTDTTTPPDTVPIPVTGYLGLTLSSPKTISGQSNLVIENLRFENASAVMINITSSSNITIRNCSFILGLAEAINIYASTNIRIENCFFFGVTTGVYASTSQTVKANYNQFSNMRMRQNPDGTYSARGQFVQYNNVTGIGNEVIGNKGENFYADYDNTRLNSPGTSNPEDMISMFGGTSGTATSPLLIRDNVGRGGGPSQSGGGIVAGDHNGSYIHISNNILLNPGQYGIAVAGGNYNVITNNKIFSRQFPWSNNPLFIWAQTGSTSCTDNIIKSNRATWTNRDGIINGGWNAGNCVNTIWEYPTPITEAEMGVPSHLIDFITPTELTYLRSR